MSRPSVVHVETPISAKNQRELMRSPVFRAFFITQFTGAFNDNFYKSALLMMFTYGGWSLWGMDINLLNNVVAALLIVPFIIFAPWMGLWADRFAYDRLIVKLKVMEILIMLGAIVAVLLESPLGLLWVVLLIGIQSACFSPLKQSIVPRLVNSQGLTGANGIVHAGTSLAIFSGLIVGSLIVQLPAGPYWVGIGALLLAVWGWHNSRRLPAMAVCNPELVVDFQPWRHLWRGWLLARSDRNVSGLIMAISWYWFLGSIYLTQIPNLARTTLQAEPIMVPVMLTLFLLGVASGGVWCERLARGQLGRENVPAGMEPGLSMIAGVGIMFASLLLMLMTSWVPAATEMRNLVTLMAEPGVWGVWLAIFLLGVSGGVFVVPLSALLQHLAPAAERARIMGANNMINALFMLIAALIGVIGLVVVNLSIPQLFLAVAGLHLLFMGWLYWRLPLLRTGCRCMWMQWQKS